MFVERVFVSAKTIFAGVGTISVAVEMILVFAKTVFAAVEIPSANTKTVFAAAKIIFAGVKVPFVGEQIAFSRGEIALVTGFMRSSSTTPLNGRSSQSTARVVMPQEESGTENSVLSFAPPLVVAETVARLH